MEVNTFASVFYFVLYLAHTISTDMALTAGSTAPDFALQDQAGAEHTLAQYRGSWIVLYFYPKDDTPGCTKEACSFRDGFAQYRKAGVVVLGVSKDTVKSHAKFADKYSLPFTLLADPDTVVIKKYDCWGKKKFMGREFEGTLRYTYLIDPTGKIAVVYTDVDTATHAATVLADIHARA